MAIQYHAVYDAFSSRGWRVVEQRTSPDGRMVRQLTLPPVFDTLDEATDYADRLTIERSRLKLS
jgi:hypothetical protein